MVAIALPGGHHYAAMWGIPDNYAGMTNSMLHRSRAFVQLAGVDVTILTYEHRDDYDAVRARLRERGSMVDGMCIANLWEQLRDLDDATLKAADGFDPDAGSTFAPLGERGDHSSPLAHEEVDADGAVVQVDYFRADGTLLVSDRRAVPGRWSRSVTLCDSSGEPIGTWRNIRDLYFFWLDTLPRDPVAWIVVDSKTSANHLVDYRRDDVVTLHVMHASHLEPGTRRPMGRIRETRQYVIERLDQWDAAIFLTQQQLSEVDALLGPGTNRHVIPHGRSVPTDPPPLKRDRRHGVMLTSLNKRKQIGQAIGAVKKASRLRLRRITLDVWGEGPAHQRLQDVIDTTHAPVALRGYSDDAWREFDRASFSLLTSSNEAFGLVLVESMGHGCIPISYDMPYGPSDIITHGVDGFLVPPDDVAALATQIRRLARTRQSELAPMRLAAHRRALELNDEHVTAAWAAVMDQALAAKP